MILKQPNPGALLSAVFDRQSPTREVEVEAFEAALRRVHANMPTFLTVERERDGKLYIDIFPTDVRAMAEGNAKPSDPAGVIDTVKKTAAPTATDARGPLPGAPVSRGAGLRAGAPKPQPKR